ncbi:hypothetical protein ET989_11520 [Propioniciclava sinopodophylli]|uniref:Molybdate ABC transporter substrate-binding protein n=1 Tax=Propioniciclava sinopodophylli TaxID=1837344 RepID=A0A4V2JSA0_9ACTN|nr:hypothetical protein ET989_11520 [Propioniciclava sinopodophylli]
MHSPSRCTSKVNLHPLEQVQIHFRGAPARCGAVAVVALALTSVGCSTGPAASAPTGPRPVTVFAAASLTAAFTEIAELDPNLDVTLNFDGSPTLVDQIKGGAPADVLATADEANMAKATEAGMGHPIRRSSPPTPACSSCRRATPPRSPASTPPWTAPGWSSGPRRAVWRHRPGDRRGRRGSP